MKKKPSENLEIALEKIKDYNNFISLGTAWDAEGNHITTKFGKAVKFSGYGALIGGFWDILASEESRYLNKASNKLFGRSFIASVDDQGHTDVMTVYKLAIEMAKEMETKDIGENR